MPDKQELRELLASGKLRQAIQGVLALAQGLPDSDTYNQALHLSSRFSILQNSINMGLISTDQAQVQQAQISNAFLFLLNQLPEEEVPE